MHFGISSQVTSPTLVPGPYGLVVAFLSVVNCCFGLLLSLKRTAKTLRAETLPICWFFRGDPHDSRLVVVPIVADCCGFSLAHPLEEDRLGCW